MEKLLRKLREEHAYVFATLEKARRLGLHTGNGQKLLMQGLQRLKKHREALNNSQADDLKQLLDFYKVELGQFFDQSRKFTQKSFLLSIQGRSCNEHFAKLIGKFKKRVSLETRLISKAVKGPLKS